MNAAGQRKRHECDKSPTNPYNRGSAFWTRVSDGRREKRGGGMLVWSKREGVCSHRRTMDFYFQYRLLQHLVPDSLYTRCYRCLWTSLKPSQGAAMATRDTFSIAMQKDSRGPSRYKCATDIHVTAVSLQLWYQTPSCVYTTWHQSTTWIHHLTLEYETHGSSPLRVGSMPHYYKHATSSVYTKGHVSAPLSMWNEGQYIISFY